ncbi:MAG: DUF2520 domain-containing protein [Thermoleophilia bacterium]|nr:DUF2520 domain-containing protein [Thermoleophilia bacterium]
MIESVSVIGARGRVGGAMSARLDARGVRLDDPTPQVVLACVPDSAIAEVAAEIAPGPWLCHTSGATPLAALAPHTRRFTLHPLQTFTRERGPEQLDGAWAAVAAETDEGLTVARELAALLGLRAFTLDDGQRALYHAGAAVAANYLVTLRQIGGALLEAAGAPPEALDPLVARVVENGFALTGPIERGDWETVERHRTAIAAARPDLLAVYDALTEATRALVAVPA